MPKCGGKADAFDKPQPNAAFKAEARACADAARLAGRRDPELVALLHAARPLSGGRLVDAEKAFKVTLAALRRGVDPFRASVEKAQHCNGCRNAHRSHYFFCTARDKEATKPERDLRPKLEAFIRDLYTDARQEREQVRRRV